MLEAVNIFVGQLPIYFPIGYSINNPYTFFTTLVRMPVAPFKKELLEKEEFFCFTWCKYNTTYSPDETLGQGMEESFIDSFDVDCYMELPDDWRIIHMQEVEETLVSCLTEADAQAVINRKQHDYPRLYIYATSLYWAPQMKELRNWILSITKDN